jgi:hypothetical protein
MIRGRIAIHERDPKSWRAKGRKSKPAPDLPRIVEAKSPAKSKRLSGNAYQMPDGEAQPRQSAIVEPKRKSNSLLQHLLGDISDEERNRRADLAEAMLREIKRRAALAVQPWRADDGDFYQHLPTFSHTRR